MTNQGRATNIHATIGPHPQVKCNDIITDVKVALDEAEARGYAADCRDRIGGTETT